MTVLFEYLQCSGKEKKSPHKSHHRSKLKDIVRKVASEEKGTGGVKVCCFVIYFLTAACTTVCIPVVPEGV